MIDSVSMNNGDLLVDYYNGKELLAIKNTLGKIVILSNTCKCGFTKEQLDEKFTDIYERLNAIFDKCNLNGYDYYIECYDLTSSNISFHSQENVCLLGGYKVSRYKNIKSPLTEKDFTYLVSLSMVSNINSTHDFKYSYTSNIKPDYITNTNDDTNYSYYYFKLPTMIYADTQNIHYNNGDNLGNLSVTFNIDDLGNILTYKSDLNITMYNIIDLDVILNDQKFTDNIMHYDITMYCSIDGSVYNDNGSCIIASGTNPLGDSDAYKKVFRYYYQKIIY